MPDPHLKALPAPLARCLAELEKLPGVGRKSALRMLYNLMARGPEAFESLSAALGAVPLGVERCSECRTFRESGSPCPVCADPRRDRSQVCVVESASDLYLIEATVEYRGLYHVLHGLLSPIRGIRPEQLGLDVLEARLVGGEVKEVILATPPTAEGEATASYLASSLADRSLRVTRIGFGIPVGADLQYADAQTLARALTGRREYR
jgi:recombination protein RecR